MGQPDQPQKPAPPAARLTAVDAFRGFVMLLMMGELLKFAVLAKAFPDNPVWAFLAHHQDHVAWVGCSLHDLIQPGFSFLVGVSLPYSLAARRARGQSRLGMTLHAFWRAFVLVWLGIILRSLWEPMPDYGFTDTLSQIGLGYGFLFVLGFAGVRWQWLAFGAILVGYWVFFAQHPLPGSDFDWAAVGVKPEWRAAHGLEGFAAHWDKNANAASAFDQRFLNKFARPKEFVFSGGGYAVLSFIPTLATMILGLLAGGVLKDDTRSGWAKVGWMAIVGVLALAAGWGLGATGICPVVKRILTPSWVLFSGGWCLLILAAFYAVTDVRGWRGWAFPLVVVGMNSIAAYCMSTSFIKPQVGGMVMRHLGLNAFTWAGPEYVALLHGAVTLAVLWLILFWMYRRKLFLRV
jgi:predicted acyltransferase